ncbi:MAG: transposase [Clostridiaceae bacterium]|jgi:transposase|nr:transposase [Clostridiaceae bacterium]
MHENQTPFFFITAAAAKFKLSDSRCEAINNKIKAIARTAFGFHNTDHLIGMVGIGS